MDDLEQHSAIIKDEAKRLGFDACGIAPAIILHKEKEKLNQWLSLGYHGTMQYMENHAEKRGDVTKLVPGTKSVIVVLLNYFTDKKQADPGAPVISKYAYGKDYHKLIRKKLYSLLQIINTTIGKTAGRAFSDSAPVMDKAWAVRAGTGWMGKNSNLIVPGKGSFFFIGTLMIDRPLHYDKPITDLCGDCDRCIRACPTGAIVKPYLIDGSRCISYLTIENKGDIPAAFRGRLKNRVFGCDICQDVCAWNRQATPHNTKELSPVKGLLEMSREEFYQLTEEQFNTLFSGSAVKRVGYKGFMRNLKFLKEAPWESISAAGK
ncbi:MAG: tRNA epoxyqueuosine(34) reductase QueG [Bacteroidales bacterium]|nr:tRNA epoxyqueuosine(34) reductase QueG [Bacteroidales bacterium]MBN2762743.1 tRNA epoxyqueuosine(34) reductase QueG [Bacteroidales bacterium]